MVDERGGPRPPFSTSTNTPLDGHLVLAVGADPVRGVLVDVPFSVLGCTACITAITVQSIHFATPSTHPMKGIAEGPRWWRFGSGFGRWRSRAAEGRCAPAGGAFEGLGGGAWEVSPAPIISPMDDCRSGTSTHGWRPSPCSCNTTKCQRNPLS